MSNVIIGIIGVVLFIGLALAGASYLGVRFKTAADDSKAAIMSSQISQVAGAFAAHQAREGVPAPGSNASSIVPRYLKSEPVNLSGQTSMFNSIDATGTLNGAGTMIVVGMYDGDLERGTRVCRALARNMHQTLPSNGNPRISSLSELATPIGCFQPTQAIGALTADRVYAFAKY